MERTLTIPLDEGLYQRFEMALQLNGERREQVLDALLRSYVARTFSQEAAAYGRAHAPAAQTHDAYYGKAIHRIPKWAASPTQYNHKIIRAYFQLAENGVVTRDRLAARCGDKAGHPDVYVSTFSSNFDQMKFDSDRSHGKVFEVDGDGAVTLWDHVAPRLLEYQRAFLCHTTDAGFVNGNGQRNLGRTERSGSDHMQYLYAMRCEHCGHEYHANGTDIFQKKCPHCQGGTDTGRK